MSLCWTYISAAHAICITRGLHRKSSVRNDSFAVAENKRFIFWTLYSLDKNLSLNLGRTSNFQDSDIDAEYFSFSDNPKQRMWDMFNGFLIRFSAVQGEAYNRLYSVSALKASAEDREKVVNELAAKSIALREELHGVCYSPHRVLRKYSLDVASAVGFNRCVFCGLSGSDDFVHRLHHLFRPDRHLPSQLVEQQLHHQLQML